MAHHTNTIKLGKSNVGFHVLNNLFLTLCLIIVAVPLVIVLSQSISDPSAVLNGRVTLMPVGFTLKTYTYVFADRMIMTGYVNSIIYTVIGTAIAVFLTVCASYALSVKSLRGGRFILLLFTFTMIFSGGMIPTYLQIRSLKMIDTLWAIILPNAVSAYNLIIARTFFMNTIPGEIYESAEIDGASDMGMFVRIALPLSGSIIAIMALFYAVGLWNVYFDALIYLNSSDKYPLQMVLRNIMSNAQIQSQMVESTGSTVKNTEMMALTEALKYATIVCASVPMLILYPFIQKHFTKGLMIGSIKG